MKKILSIALTIAVALCGTKAMAQVSIGAGYLNSTQKVTAGVSKNVAMNGVYAGFDYNYAVGESGLGIAPGIYYEFITASADKLLNTVNLGGILSGKLDEHYINIPVNLNFRTTIADGIKGFVYAGPTFSMGVSSKAKAEGFGIKVTVSDNYKHDYFNQFDVLVGGGIGLDFSDMVRFTVGYNVGCFNRAGDALRNQEGNSAVTLNRNELHVGLAYLF